MEKDAEKLTKEIKSMVENIDNLKSGFDIFGALVEKAFAPAK